MKHTTMNQRVMAYKRLAGLYSGTMKRKGTAKGQAKGAKGGHKA